MATELNTNLENPPITETVIGVQFTPIAGFTSGHFGWYWKEALDASWKTIEAPPIPDQFERFDGQQARIPSLQLQFLPLNQPNRLQFVSTNDDRVIQVQNTKFMYNWRKREAVYPSFNAIYPEFSVKLEGFRRFLGLAGLEPLSPNQWEITYINHIPKEGLWENATDWSKILPGLYPPPLEANIVRLESAAVELHFEISQRLGRLHISAQHGRANDGGGEILILQLTARGPVSSSDPIGGLDSGLNLGHRVLVDTFARIASRDTLEFWGMN